MNHHEPHIPLATLIDKRSPTVRASLAITLITLAAAATALVIARRCLGALSNPLDARSLLVVGFSAVASAAYAGEVIGARCDWRRQVIITIALVAVAVSLSLPGSPTFGLVALWSLVAAQSALAWRCHYDRAKKSCATAGSPSSECGQPASEPEPAGNVQSLLGKPAVALVPETTEDEGTIVQQLTRSRDASGGESLHGTIRVDIAPGERTVVTHIAFCPSFDFTPECSAEAIEGPPARVKVTQSLPHGARIEVKLEAAATTSETATLELSAWRPE